MDEQELDIYRRDRLLQLKEAKNRGAKIIGYFPGNYLPEELIYAAGAIPICLINSGDVHLLDTSLSAISRIFCPFARTQVGERLVRQDPFYSMLDMLVAPITCQHMKKAAEIWEYYGDIEIFKLGIPHQYSENFTLEYYIDRLKALREQLETFTGNEVTHEKIGDAIELYNRIRDLLRKISLTRRRNPSPISTLDFIKLNHVSYYADPAFMADMLESVYRELKVNQVATTAPRLLLIGPNVAYGDYGLLESVKDAGGEVVIEEVCEGVRYYWQTVYNNGDPFESLAKAYLIDRIPCAFMRDSAQKRLDFGLELIRDFNVSGVIWYELIGCETYDEESYFFAQKLEELNIPMLIIESDYGMRYTGQIQTRIEAFVEMLMRGAEYD
jgi:benzoyl-CoA reductase/2-hydroxyglutaryl-CoA dehydratase subunit BcrC/BadD/HgdB